MDEKLGFPMSFSTENGQGEEPHVLIDITRIRLLEVTDDSMSECPSGKDFFSVQAVFLTPSHTRQIESKVEQFRSETTINKPAFSRCVEDCSWKDLSGPALEQHRVTKAIAQLTVLDLAKRSQVGTSFCASPWAIVTTKKSEIVEGNLVIPNSDMTGFYFRRGLTLDWEILFSLDTALSGIKDTIRSNNGQIDIRYYHYPRPIDFQENTLLQK